MEEMSAKLRYRTESPTPSGFQQGKQLYCAEAFHSIPVGLGEALRTLPLQHYFSWWCFDCKERVFLKHNDFVPKPCLVVRRSM